MALSSLTNFVPFVGAWHLSREGVRVWVHDGQIGHSHLGPVGA